jgi:chorismate-pyruvate lyase
MKMPASSEADTLAAAEPKRSLAQTHVNPRTLTPLQRILLATDGTVTDILEARYDEAIRSVKIFQAPMTAHDDVCSLALNGEELVLRKVLLRGTVSQRNYVYAESMLVPSRLELMMHDLEQADIPIGRLMRRMRMESFREILGCWLEPAREIGEYFGVETHTDIIARKYQIFVRGQPAMLITEKFPSSTLQD